jgi:hypothetical protein
MSALHEQLKQQLLEVPPPARVLPQTGVTGSLRSATCAQSGQLEALRQQLRERLVDAGWRDELAEQARTAGRPASVQRKRAWSLTQDALARCATRSAAK